jgi:hypothetical protein
MIDHGCYLHQVMAGRLPDYIFTVMEGVIPYRPALYASLRICNYTLRFVKDNTAAAQRNHEMDDLSEHCFCPVRI